MVGKKNRLSGRMLECWNAGMAAMATAKLNDQKEILFFGMMQNY